MTATLHRRVVHGVPPAGAPCADLGADGARAAVGDAAAGVQPLTGVWRDADGRGGRAALRRDGRAPGRRDEGLLAVAVGASRAPHLLVADLGERLDNTPLGAALAAEDRPALAQRFQPEPGGATLLREVLLHHGHAAALVRYTLVGSAPATLTLEPRLPFRALNGRTWANGALVAESVELGGAVWLRPYPSLPALRIACDARAVFTGAPHWKRGVPLVDEGAAEDQFIPGTFTLTLTPGVAATFEFAVAGEASNDPGGTFRAERARRATQTLQRAAIERLVARDAAGEPFCVAEGAHAPELLPLLAAAGVPRAALAASVPPCPLTRAWADEVLDGARRDAESGAQSERLAELEAALTELSDGAPCPSPPLTFALATDLFGRLAERATEPAVQRHALRLRRLAVSQFAAARARDTARPAVSARAAALRHAPLDEAERRVTAELASALERLTREGEGPEALIWPSAIAAAFRAVPPTRALLVELRAALASLAATALTQGDAAVAAAWLAADVLVGDGALPEDSGHGGTLR